MHTSFWRYCLQCYISRTRSPIWTLKLGSLLTVNAQDQGACVHRSATMFGCLGGRNFDARSYEPPPRQGGRGRYEGSWLHHFTFHCFNLIPPLTSCQHDV